MAFRPALRPALKDAPFVEAEFSKLCLWVLWDIRYCKLGLVVTATRLKAAYFAGEQVSFKFHETHIVLHFVTSGCFSVLDRFQRHRCQVSSPNAWNLQHCS